MLLEMLHTVHGDRTKKYDTSTEKGRNEVSQVLSKAMKAGTAILLERPGKKAYYVKSYDPKSDTLTVSVEKKGKTKQVKTSAKKAKVVGVPHAAGGTDSDVAVIRHPVLPEDEGNPSFVRMFPTKPKAEKWIEEQEAEYFKPSDYFILERK